ncbi:Na-translocating system protein MpsC family protein [Paenibacillus sp. FJAT-26967]|uniref:Na-translocating system protein MpsC family protein n=1 Tax=Paenibacillus sp. FJAT-26967 TaxID=1729690 RepID=UPI00083804D2|nr:Na-translocating system protein MpsC family protein [Paenibacillus sp. FJAT-26967]
MDKKTALSHLSSQTGKMLRERFGKGPESIFISYNEYGITLHFRNFVSAVETILLDKQKDEAVRETRQMVMDVLLPELKESIQQTIGLSIQEMYYDWDLENHSGIMIGLTNESHSGVQECYTGYEKVHDQISQITADVQRFPDHVFSFWTNPRTLVIVREGILIKLEKELLKTGYENALRVAKRSLEKLHLVEDTDLVEALGKKVNGLYLDWSFDKDKSVAVYTFQ